MIVVLIYCNVVNSNYQHESRVLHAFAPNKSFGQLLEILSKILYFSEALTQRSCILRYGLLLKTLNL